MTKYNWVIEIIRQKGDKFKDYRMQNLSWIGIELSDDLVCAVH